MSADPTELDLAELRRVAEGATPGPWSSGVIWGVVHYRRANFDCADIADVRQSPDPMPNARHIAAWSPSVALRLLARLERAEAVCERAAHILSDGADCVDAAYLAPVLDSWRANWRGHDSACTDPNCNGCP